MSDLFILGCAPNLSFNVNVAVFTLSNSLCHFESISQMLFQQSLRVQQLFFHLLLFWIIIFTSSLLSLSLSCSLGPDNYTRLLSLDLSGGFFCHCSLMSALYSVKCGMQALSLSFLVVWVYEQTQQLETSAFLPACSLEHSTVEDNAVLSLPALSHCRSFLEWEVCSGAWNNMVVILWSSHHCVLTASLRVLEIHWQHRQR